MAQVDSLTGRPTPSALAAEINRDTRDLHDIVNNLVSSRLALGLQDYRLFREGFLSFFYVYKTFEEEWARLLASQGVLDERKQRILHEMWTPRLRRSERLLGDLCFYYKITPIEAKSKFEYAQTPQRYHYIKHIQAAVERQPLVLLAYAHIMYLALFAGGKVIKRQMTISESFWPSQKQSIQEGQGLGLFTFDVPKGKEEEIRHDFKVRLGSIENELTIEERRDIIAEAREIFLQNKLLIEELDVLCAQIAANEHKRALRQDSSTSGFKNLTGLIIALVLGTVVACVIPARAAFSNLFSFS